MPEGARGRVGGRVWAEAHADSVRVANDADGAQAAADEADSRGWGGGGRRWIHRDGGWKPRQMARGGARTTPRQVEQPDPRRAETLLMRMRADVESFD